MKFRTVCAWCNRLISEKECPKTKNSLALSKNGVMISHGLCPRCRKNLENIYGLKKGGSNNV
ncbi:hypothetical protein [uncultured Desulfobacter sp.]|uniref:hypothetical protein n=1 Tax=uncultured Desulfobacter sp. TaxID=240139 RepID=UPI0029C7EAA3|nr:hypothetical protein [uncultured Desulfobacter sp.]